VRYTRVTRAAEKNNETNITRRRRNVISNSRKRDEIIASAGANGANGAIGAKWRK